MSRPKLITQPTRVRAAGNKPKLIDEYIGRVNSGNSDVSVAHMRSPGGWQEPGQTPEFDEITVVLSGMIRVEYLGGSLEVRGGQAVIAHKGDWGAIAHRSRRERNISQSAYLRFRWTRFTGTSEGQGMKSGLPEVVAQVRSEGCALLSGTAGDGFARALDGAR